MIQFDEIKERIERYKQSSLIKEILIRLDIIQKNTKYHYPFWELLVLLEWTYVYGKDKFRPSATQLNLNHLLSLVEKYGSEYSVNSFTSAKNVKQFFRRAAYQQFSHQDKFYNGLVDRQIILYIQSDSVFDIDASFETRTGINITQFLNYCYLTYIYLNSDELGSRFTYTGILSTDYFNYFSQKFSKGELDKFLSLLTIKDVKDFKGLHRLNNPILQIFETNLFTCKPFLFFRNEYRLPHRTIFTQTVSHFIYTYMKKNEPQFPGEFGKRLEKYVELGLKENKKEYLSENQLRNKYHLNKVIDFLTETNILIEVKATELHPRSGVLRESDVMMNDMQSSIVKAYRQLLSTAHSIDNTISWYGIVVTYREMYLGFGPDAFEEFLQEPIDFFLKENNIDIKVLPPSNLFFISISDWDWIVQALKDSLAASLREILLKGQELNNSEDQQTKVFMMEQVLSRHFQINLFTLSYLKKGHQLIDVLHDNSIL